jgi:hypothetical protein
VWAASTTSGRVCVLKFHKHRDEAKTLLENETKICNQVWGKDLYARIQTVCGRPTLVMPYLSPCPTPPSTELEQAIRKAVAQVAKAGFRHNDLKHEASGPKWEHVGLYKRGGLWKAALLDFGNTISRDIFQKTKTQADEDEEAMLQDLGLDASSSFSSSQGSSLSSSSSPDKKAKIY